MKTLQLNWNKIIGLIIIVLSIFWMFQNVRLFYWYHYTDMLFAFMLPDWVLFMQIILASINLMIGYKLIIKKLTVKKGLLYFLLLFFIGVVINLFYYSISEFLGLVP